MSHIIVKWFIRLSSFVSLIILHHYHTIALNPHHEQPMKLTIYSSEGLNIKSTLEYPVYKLQKALSYIYVSLHACTHGRQALWMFTFTDTKLSLERFVQAPRTKDCRSKLRQLHVQNYVQVLQPKSWQRHGNEAILKPQMQGE